MISLPDPRRVVGMAAVAAVTCVLAACGDSSSSPPAIDAAAQAQLRHDVHAVAAALAAHQPARARSALQILNADTAAAHAAGKLSKAKLAQIRTAASTLAADLDRLVTSPAPTVTITRTAPPADDKGKDEGGGNGNEGGGNGDEGGGNGNEGNGGKQG